MENNNVSMKKSTLWKSTVIILIVVLGFLAFRGNFKTGVTGNSVADVNANLYADLSFKEVCAKTGGMWMKMQPTENNIPTGQPACSGCMLRNGDHICERERYVQALQTQ